MFKFRIYGCPFIQGSKLTNPYIDLIAKRDFNFYTNYRYANNLVSSRKIPHNNLTRYQKSTADQWLSCFRRTVLFSDSTDLIPLKNFDIFSQDLYDRACKTLSLDHTTCWMNSRGVFFILTEPYVVNNNFEQLLKVNNLVHIVVPQNLSPYCGSWDEEIGSSPGTTSYLICDVRDLNDLKEISKNLTLINSGFIHSNSEPVSTWNSLKEINYV